MSTASVGHWLHSHKDSAKKSTRRALNSPLSFLFTILLIAIAFSVPIGIYTLFSSIERLTDQWDGDRNITLFLTQDTTFKRAEKISKDLSVDVDIENVEVINKDAVLNQFRQETNFNLFPAGSTENPLPHIIIISPPSGTDITTITQELGSISEVHHVQFDLLWFQRLQAFSIVILRIQWIATILLIFTVALIIINVIRWEISSRQSEIEIIKLIGASDAYVRRPFMYYGGLLGLTGAAVAVLIVTLCTLIINLALNDLTALFDSDYTISYLPGLLAVLVIVLGGMVGILAASLAANQKIKTIS